MQKGTLLTLLLLTVKTTYANFFTSLSDMEALFKRETSMLQTLERHINECEENIVHIKKKMLEMKLSQMNITDPSNYLQNPLNSYAFMKSLRDFDKSLSAFFKPAMMILDLLDDLDEIGGRPSDDDIDGALNAILRLQTTYDLNIDQIVRGNVHGFKATPLTVNDCMSIGEIAKLHDKTTARKWLKKAYEMCQESDNDCDLPLKLTTAEHYAYSEFDNDNLSKALEITYYILELEPNHNRAIINEEYLKEEINNVPLASRTAKFMLAPDGNVDLEKVYYFNCRGIAKQSKNILNKLTCQYIHYNNPYLMLGPIKVEEANLEPRIVIIKDIIHESEVQDIQEMAKPKLERSVTQAGVSNEVRVSKVAWLDSKDGKLPDQLISRFSIYSNLSPMSAESLQVANYGLGGHYLPHYDAFTPEISNKTWGSYGNRIATLLVYLNDVDMGGTTVFPRLGLSVKPEKRTAVLWYNLHNDGVVDRETLHAACPVLIGTKWAINMWFHEAWNEINRPCQYPSSQTFTT